MKKFLESGLTIDVGSSTGGVLYGLREKRSDLKVLGIEPSEKESSFAEKQGVRTFQGLFENLAPEIRNFGNPKNIFCVRSLNHLLDPRAFFEWSYNTLESGGHLILYVKNFRHQVKRSGRVEAGVQIDHPYMFTPETLKLFVESVGFKVMYLDIDEYKSQAELLRQRKEGLSRHHIMLVAEKPIGISQRNTKISRKDIYRKIRWQLSRPYLKLYYILFYSHRLNFLRRLFNS